MLVLHGLARITMAEDLHHGPLRNVLLRQSAGDVVAEVVEMQIGNPEVLDEPSDAVACPRRLLSRMQPVRARQQWPVRCRRTLPPSSP